MSDTVDSNVPELSKNRCITLAYGIHRARAALESHLETFAQARGLEVAHLSILHTLGLGGEMRMSDLAARVIVGPATVTRRAKQLEERSLVSRKRSNQSQREVLISLTSLGESMFEDSFFHLHDQHSAYFDDRFSLKEQQLLEQLFERL